MFDTWGLNRAPQEVAWVLAIDAARHVRTVVEVARGAGHWMNVHIPAVLQAVLLSGSDRWAFVHCHPSLDATPTGMDHNLLDRLTRASEACGIYLEDSIIVTPDPKIWYSAVLSDDYTPMTFQTNSAP